MTVKRILVVSSSTDNRLFNFWRYFEFRQDPPPRRGEYTFAFYPPLSRKDFNQIRSQITDFVTSAPHLRYVGCALLRAAGKGLASALLRSGEAPQEAVTDDKAEQPDYEVAKLWLMILAGDQTALAAMSSTDCRRLDAQMMSFVTLLCDFSESPGFLRTLLARYLEHERDAELEYLVCPAETMTPAEVLELISTPGVHPSPLWLHHAALFGAPIEVIQHLLASKLPFKVPSCREICSLYTTSMSDQVSFENMDFPFLSSVQGRASREVLEVLYEQVPAPIRTCKESMAKLAVLCAKHSGGDCAPLSVITGGDLQVLRTWDINLTLLFDEINGPPSVLQALITAVSTDELQESFVDDSKFDGASSTLTLGQHLVLAWIRSAKWDLADCLLGLDPDHLTQPSDHNGDTLACYIIQARSYRRLSTLQLSHFLALSLKGCKNDKALTARVIQALAFNCYVPDIECLLKLRPDALSEKDATGNTFLHSAALYSSLSAKSVAFILKKHPASVRTVNNDGALPIHLAAAQVTGKDVVECLVRAFPESLQVKTTRGDLPLDCMCRRGGGDVFHFFLERTVLAAPDGPAVTPAFEQMCRRNISYVAMKALLEKHPWMASTPTPQKELLPIHLHTVMNPRRRSATEHPGVFKLLHEMHPIPAVL